MPSNPAPRTAAALGLVCLMSVGASGAASATARSGPAPATEPAGVAIGPSRGTSSGAGSGAGHRAHRGFDLQAHRGGIGLTTESTREAFGKALETGVSTLELDTQITKDDQVVVSHDRRISADKCADTAPVASGDPQFPYAGKLVKELTLAQIRTLNCGYHQLPGFPQQEQVAGARMLELKDVFAVAREHHATGVHFNIETKVEAGAPQETAPREHFVARVHEEIARSGMKRQVTVQSFDWGALKVMHRLDRSIPLVALTNIDFLEVGKPGASPWLGGLDADDVGGDPVRAAATIPGVRTLSPVYGSPQDGKIGQAGFRFVVDRAMVTSAHRHGLKVVPWTVDDPATMDHLVALGVDGLITNYPDRLRRVMAAHGLALPRPYYVGPPTRR